MMARRIGCDRAPNRWSSVSSLTAAGNRGGSAAGTFESVGGTLLRNLDNIPFQAVCGLDDFGLLPLRDAERIERGGYMADRDVPFLIGNAETAMRRLHVGSGVVGGPAKGGA